MKQIIWFRRDLRIEDSAILHYANGEVLPIFIFDSNILSKLRYDDKRVSFIYKSVLLLKKKLQKINLDLAIYYGEPIEIFKNLKKIGFEKILCSVDFDSYSKNRDKEIEKILPISRYIDSFLLNPKEHLKKNCTPYVMFTPYYNSLSLISQSNHIEEYQVSKKIKLYKYDYTNAPNLEQMNFIEQNLPSFLSEDVYTLLENFKDILQNYSKNRDFFSKNGTSNLSVHLRFGIISVKQVFNYIKSLHLKNSDVFIRQLFWREFYNYLLYHFPHSEFENFKDININWRNNKQEFKMWCEGRTGIYIIDAAMQHLNKTGLMHNRLRMIVASFLTKNLLIDWRWGEKYFAEKLLDYETSTNIGSWQWAASTGADSVPYFRIFNPYTQSQKFDKDGTFIKNIIPESKNIESKLFHIESINAIIDIKSSRQRAINIFKYSKNSNIT